MPFVFVGGTDAETEFRKDLTFMYEKHGYKGSYPADQTQKFFRQMRTWCRISPTAKAMLEYIDSSNQSVHVVGMSGGFQCFSSTSGLDDKKGTIFVDLDARTEILAVTTHNLHLPKSGRERLGKVGGSWVSLDNKVTLLHEIGHSKQWIEHPGWFDNDYRTETKRGAGDAAPKLKDISALEIYAKAKAMQERTASGHGVTPMITQGAPLTEKRSGYAYPSGVKKPEVRGPKAADLSFLPDVEPGKPQRQLLEAPVGWSVPTEQDNMNRHELPICREMGLPVRANYGDIRLGGAAPAQQLTSMMKRWAEEDARKKAENMTARVGVVRKKCGDCGNEFTTMGELTKHRFATGHL